MLVVAGAGTRSMNLYVVGLVVLDTAFMIFSNDWVYVRNSHWMACETV